MRVHVGCLGILLTLGLAMPASAQFAVSGGSKTTGASFPSSSSFFAMPFGRPDFSGMSFRPSLPTPLNLGAMMPSWSHFQNAMLMRNVFTGPQAVIQIPFMPKQQVQPPPAKKKASSSIFFP